MFTDIEQEAIEIRWFFACGEHIGFVASAGGRLPLSVASSAVNTELLNAFFDDLPVNSEVSINPKLSQLIKGKVTDEYLSSFVQMAEKGLFAFDRTQPERSNDTSYHLVASPIEPLALASLPETIQDILQRTSYKDEHITAMNDIRQIA